MKRLVLIILGLLTLIGTACADTTPYTADAFKKAQDNGEKILAPIPCGILVPYLPHPGEIVGCTWSIR